MSALKNGVILPGIGVGNIKIGTRLGSLKKILNNYSVAERNPNVDVYETENIKVWVDKSKEEVTQVLVQNEFKGKFLNRFGIGSYLSEIEDFLEEKAKYEYYVYVFESIKGICFELTDIDDDWDNFEWFKKHAPIEYISVY